MPFTEACSRGRNSVDLGGGGREGGRCVEEGKETALGRKEAVLRREREALRKEEC